MLLPSTLDFLKKLAKNNSKEWFDANRIAYDRARADFLLLIDSVLKLHGPKDPDIANLDAKHCVFRINRDIRFSNNKAPYKDNFGASLDRGGKKSIYAGYYIHIKPGESFVGGGLWMPEAAELAKIRQEIDYNFDEFKSIIGNKSFRKHYPGLESSPEYKLSRPPRGYEPDNPAIEYIKLKSFLALQPLADTDITSPGFVKKIAAALAALQPLLNFLNRALE